MAGEEDGGAEQKWREKKMKQRGRRWRKEMKQIEERGGERGFSVFFFSLYFFVFSSLFHFSSSVFVFWYFPFTLVLLFLVFDFFLSRWYF